MPGGSAGTSFCSGTEISIRRLAMAFPHKFGCIQSAFPALRIALGGSLSGSLSVLALEFIFQDSDFLDFEFDAVTMFKIPAEFKSATIADGAGSDEFAGHPRFIFGDM